MAATADAPAPAAADVDTATSGTPAAGDRSPRSGFSVRVRMTALFAELLLVAMAGAGLLVYLVESEHVEQQAAAQVDQEFAELDKLVEDRLRAAARAPSVQTILRSFLQRNVPADNEILVGWWGDEPQITFPQDPVVADERFAPLARAVISDSRDTIVELPGHGELLVSAQQLRGDEDGALVVLVRLDDARAGLTDTMVTYAIVAFLALLVVTAAAAWLSGRLLAPLRTLRQTAEEITETDLSRRLAETGNDDITALTSTVNGMLERLETAFADQREFLDDAGHELRTPLTVVRGHLELLDADDPADVAETRALLLDEVDRMSRLVGDLILLAKSARPDFLEVRPSAVDRIVTGALARARVLGDRHWVVEERTYEVRVVDAQRLTQALLQLADNAVKHTAPGDTVAFGAASDESALRLWVRDTGPGIPPQDRERVFTRFGRSHVPDGDEGFGLGLSIVSAIAEAHGGSVHYEDAGPGARIVITLPHREDPWLTS